MEKPEVLSRIESGCRVGGCHAVSTVIVGADNQDVIRLCLRHAKDWSNSDLCHDFAATGHTNSMWVLAKWLSIKSQTEIPSRVSARPSRPVPGPQSLLASVAR